MKFHGNKSIKISETYQSQNDQRSYVNVWLKEGRRIYRPCFGTLQEPTFRER